MDSNNTWLLWRDTARCPELNMGIDEALLEYAPKISFPVFRIYDWNVKSMSIGYIQKFDSTARPGYKIIRRPTGGGVVFHDVDLTYTVVIPKGHEIEQLNRSESYNIIHKAVIAALNFIGIECELTEKTTAHKKRFSMQCFTAPVRYDVMLKKKPGNSLSVNRKIAGAAQRRTSSGILHQGSIVLDDIEDVKKPLSESLITAFKQTLKSDFKPFKDDGTIIRRAECLAHTKYSRDSWNKKR
jgi:lipoate-protein ligase A